MRLGRDEIIQRKMNCHEKVRGVALVFSEHVTEIQPWPESGFRFTWRGEAARANQLEPIAG
jgi:hypothetical protein